MLKIEMRPLDEWVDATADWSAGRLVPWMVGQSIGRVWSDKWFNGVARWVRDGRPTTSIL